MRPVVDGPRVLALLAALGREAEGGPGLPHGRHDRGPRGLAAEKDLLDVDAFVACGLVRPERLREPRLGERYAFDAPSFRANVDALFPPAGGFTP